MDAHREERAIALESLIVEALAACEASAPEQRGEVVDALCARHPEHADALRRKLANLARVGLAEPGGPQRLGPYAILRLLGAGGMGRVYLGLQREPVVRLAAVKVLRPDVALGSGFARFELERRTLASMDHDGIARVYETGTQDGTPWFAMEYVDGDPITVALDARRATIDERLRTFLRVLRAVHHAHRQGVLHRDLKPTNVLCRVDDEGLHPKVIDFGLARAMAPGEDATRLTHAGGIVGTPEYMSPEQFLRAEAVDVRADVYALGVCLYEVLTGELPVPSALLRSSDLEHVLRAVRDQRPRSLLAALPAEGQVRAQRAALRSTSPVSLVRRLGSELAWIVAKALAKERDERYDSAAAFADDLERLLRSEPLAAGPQTPWYRARTFLRRHRTGVAIAAAFLLLLVAGLIATWISYLDAERERLVTRTFAMHRRLRECLTIAREDLWPAHPARDPAMTDWITEVESYAEERGPLLAQARPEPATPRARTDRGLLDLADAGAAQREARELLARLEEVLGPDDPNDPLSYGTLASVRARRAFARDLERRTLLEPAAAWIEAIRSIADPALCPRYRGLRIVPQLGLIPLGRHPRSGLWEFRLVQMGGTAPIWTEDEGARVDGTSDLVLVLLPGGEATVGSQDLDPAGPHFDGERSTNDTPLAQVTIAPHFLSKYEMTIGQWRRIARFVPAGQPLDHEAPYGDERPVVSISGEDALRELARLGCRLPDEHEWEVAARAGSTAPWWTGADPRSLGFVAEDGRERLLPAANVLDESYVLSGAPHQEGRAVPWSDGFVATAPVGSLRANPFGLHDVLGNVWEICRPHAGRREEVTLEPAPRLFAIRWRGGAWNSHPGYLKATFSIQRSLASSQQNAGVRPARDLQPPPAERTP